VFGITFASFAHAGAVAREGATEVAVGIVLIVEEKMTLTLLIVLLFFLCLYCSYNKNTKKEK
jgi:hypothetical protein